MIQFLLLLFLVSYGGHSLMVCTLHSGLAGGVGRILGQIVALLSSLSTKWNQLPDENKNNQTSFIGLESLPCQACWDRWRSFWHPSDHPVGFVQHEAFTGWNPIFFCWRVTFVSPLSNAKHYLPPPIPLPQKTLSHCLLLPLSPL